MTDHCALSCNCSLFVICLLQKCRAHILLSFCCFCVCCSFLISFICFCLLCLTTQAFHYVFISPCAFICQTRSYSARFTCVRDNATCIVMTFAIHVNRKQFKTGTIKVKVEQFKTETAYLCSLFTVLNGVV